MSFSEEVIKLFEYIIEKTRDVLPEPVFKWDSIVFGLFWAGCISAGLFVIGCIAALVLYIIYGENNTLVTITRYDKDGKKIDVEKETQKGWKEPKNECERQFVDGVISEKVCKTKKKYYTPLIVFIITLISSIIIFVQLYFMFVDWHYGRRLKYSNPYHKALIDYLHRYILPIEFAENGIQLPNQNINYSSK